MEFLYTMGYINPAENIEKSDCVASKSDVELLTPVFKQLSGSDTNTGDEDGWYSSLFLIRP